MDSVASHHHTNYVTRLHNDYKNHSGRVATAGNESLELSVKGPHSNYGSVKLVPEMGRSFFSIGQMTKNSDVTMIFIDYKFIIKKGQRIMAVGNRGLNNLYCTD